MSYHSRFMSEILDEMDRDGALASFYDQYRGDGRGSAAYHPLMMVKVLVYGYGVGITSSSRIAQALEGSGSGERITMMEVREPLSPHP